MSNNTAAGGDVRADPLQLEAASNDRFCAVYGASGFIHAWLKAITGQLYLAVLVAILIGTLIAKSMLRGQTV